MPLTRSGSRAQSILWQRLDVSGHDACTVENTAIGWRIEGCAVFESNAKPARFTYVVNCNHDWQTQNALIAGRIGGKVVKATIKRSVRGAWKLNGVAQPQLNGCDDLDIAFTPATNTIAIRRLALRVDESANVRAAWLNIEDNEFSVLEQTYTRIAKDRFQYHSPRFNFRAQLVVNSSGLVTRYPKLWKASS